MALFQDEVIEDHKVEYDLLKVYAYQINVVRWPISELLLKGKVHHYVIYGATAHDGEHQDEKEVHLLYARVVRDYRIG